MGIERLPRTLSEATKKLEASAVAREILGKQLVEHFVATRKHECQLFDREVTDWEIKRYFEAI